MFKMNIKVYICFQALQLALTFYIFQAKAEVVAQSIRDRQGHAAAFQSDVTCPKTMEACATSIRNTFGN